MEEDGFETFSQPRPLGFRGPSRQTAQQAPPPPPIDPMLDSKASQLETEIRQQNTSIKSVLDSLKHLEASQLPSMATTLQNLRTAIERIVVADIPNAIKPIEDDAARVRQKFDKFSSETQGKLQNLREKLAETSASISQLSSRYQDLSQTTTATVSDIDADLRRSKETLESASQRLTSLEGGLRQADSILRNLKGEIQALGRAFNEKVAQFQNEATTSFGATASQLNQELKAERAIRMQTVSQEFGVRTAVLELCQPNFHQPLGKSRMHQCANGLINCRLILSSG
jgi:chromosome segregation ATPase